MLRTDTLELTEINGDNDFECGKEYGDVLRPLILGFYNQEVVEKDPHLIFAEKCWGIIKEYALSSASFIRGLSKSIGLTPIQLTLLSLHEEIFARTPHCSAFAVLRKRDVIVAENWDWPPRFYPWPGLLRMSSSEQPRKLTYHYPGLWSACGINEYGLALMWTGSGYFPKVRSRVGIPTYILVSEVLNCRTIGEALIYLRAVKNAGCFIFVLGDAEGNSCVVEAVPGTLSVRKTKNFVCRTNHFKCPRIVSLSHQSLLRSSSNHETEERFLLMQKSLAAERYGSSRLRRYQTILTEEPTLYNIGIEEYDSITIDCLLVECKKRLLRYRRGGKIHGRWHSINV